MKKFSDIYELKRFVNLNGENKPTFLSSGLWPNVISIENCF